MAGTPAAKLFSLLEVLQARPSATGAELAEALGVTERTLRRYVQRLVDLGIPVDSERGPYGGYRLRPRFRLPPLMLTADEAVAVTLGLVVGQRLGVGAAVPAAAAALAKLLRVLPDPLRERVAALQDSLGVVVPPQRGADVDPSVLADLGAAAGLRRRVRFVHRSAGGNDRQRSVDPYGVVFHAGRWYLVGHDHLRADLRTFRLDRLRDVTTTGERFTPPDDFDPVAHLVRSLAEVPYGWDVEVVLHIDIEAARRLIAPTVGTIEPHPQGALLRVGAESPQSAARHLMMMGVPFTVIRPDEVRQALRDLAGKRSRLPLLPCTRVAQEAEVANLTLTVDDEVLRRARIRALEQGTSVNAAVRTYLEAVAGGSTSRDAISAFLEIAGRAQAGSGPGGRGWDRDDIYEERVG